MAEEPLNPEETPAAAAAAVTTTESEVVSEVPPVVETTEVEESVVVVEREEEEAKKIGIGESVSFKEETNVVGDLPESQKKALDELKKLVRDALDKHEFTPPVPPPPPPPPQQQPEPAAAEAKEDEKKDDKIEEEVPAPQTEEAAAVTPVVADETIPVEEGKSAAAAATVTESSAVEAAPPPLSEPPTVEVVEAAAAVVTEDNGAKTVEAIEETIVAVAEPAAAPEPQEKEEEEEKEAVVEAPAKEEAQPEPESAVEQQPEPPLLPEEVFLWGIPLLGDERSDTVLLKFLRARDFKVKDAFTMIKNTVRWRKEFGVDSLLEEDLGTDYENVVFVHGLDKEKRPVVYNVLGEFQNKELYQNTFLKWLVQFLERTVRKFDFSSTGINSLVLVNDLKNSPGYDKVTNKFLHLLQDNYPEFVFKQVCINVSWWYLAYSWVYISVFTPRSKSKFMFASTTKTAETLFKYIAPEHVPVQYGGHSRAGELEFTTEDSVTEVNIKPGGKHAVEFSFTEPSVLVWELRVVGWDVTYEAQFIPGEGYTVLVSKPKKFTLSDDPIITDSFKITEPGKVVLSIDNQSSKKKKLLYRSKIKPSE